MYKHFLTRTGGTWLLFLEEKRALSFLSHVQVGAPTPPTPLMGINGFFSRGKGYIGLNLSAYLR